MKRSLITSQLRMCFKLEAVSKAFSKLEACHNVHCDMYIGIKNFKLKCNWQLVPKIFKFDKDMSHSLTEFFLSMFILSPVPWQPSSV